MANRWGQYQRCQCYRFPFPLTGRQQVESFVPSWLAASVARVGTFVMVLRLRDGTALSATSVSHAQRVFAITHIASSHRCCIRLPCHACTSRDSSDCSAHACLWTASASLVALFCFSLLSVLSFKLPGALAVDEWPGRLSACVALLQKTKGAGTRLRDLHPLGRPSWHAIPIATNNWYWAARDTSQRIPTVHDTTAGLVPLPM